MVIIGTMFMLMDIADMKVGAGPGEEGDKPHNPRDTNIPDKYL
jgi:hypothetical protein